MTEPSGFTVEPFTADQLRADLPALAAVLHACVEDGASVGFVLPYGMDEAAAFFERKVLPGLAAGGLMMLVARMGGRIVGTVQLDHDTMPNQRHRAEVRKLLVHPDARRKGVATALMRAIEADARRLGRTLLTLDTRTGDGAEPLYLGLGYKIAGRIPDFCRDTVSERLDPTTLMYKRL